MTRDNIPVLLALADPALGLGAGRICQVPGDRPSQLQFQGAVYNHVNTCLRGTDKNSQPTVSRHSGAVLLGGASGGSSSSSSFGGGGGAAGGTKPWRHESLRRRRRGHDDGLIPKWACSMATLISTACSSKSLEGEAYRRKEAHLDIPVGTRDTMLLHSEQQTLYQE